MSWYRSWLTARTRTGPATLIVALATILVGCSPSGQTQETFSTPEEAVEAMIEAFSADATGAGLLAIFGEENTDLLSSGDPVDDRIQRQVVFVALQQGWRLVDQGPDTKELIIGHEDWPFPIPLTRESSGWRFDTEAGEEEVLARRIGRNELSVIDFCATHVQAQREYATRKHDDQPAGTYAQRVASDPGTENGLYWEVSPGERPSPLGALVAQATTEGYSSPDATAGPKPFHGYFFRILTAQGEAAQGGAMSYIQDGDMKGGFALVAYPAEYADSGVMTFIVNQDGVIYEKDLGEDSLEAASQMTEYNPDSTWAVVE